MYQVPNIFDIQQGVAIAFFIKYQDSQQDLAKVYHADLWGIREVKENKELVGGKYYWLDENDISSTEWRKLEPHLEFYLFVKNDANLQSEYDQYWNLPKITLSNSVGLYTARDSLTIQFNQNQISMLNSIYLFSIILIHKMLYKFKGAS